MYMYLKTYQVTMIIFCWNFWQAKVKKKMYNLETWRLLGIDGSYTVVVIFFLFAVVLYWRSDSRIIM